jgi:signal transduction histidine kinase
VTSQGLPRRLRYAFVLQVAVATLLVIVGAAIAGSVAKDMLTSWQLRDEVDDYWRGRAGDASHPLPHGATLRGYFVATGKPADDVPAELRVLAPGISALPGRNHKAIVDDRAEGRLYLEMSFDRIDAVIRRIGTVSVLLALIAVYAATWFTYRTSKRLVVPVNWLARQVSRWDPRDPDVESIAPWRSPGEAGSEIRQLSGALRGLSKRTHDLLQRERDFTRDASHELRTPLTVIRVATDMMLSDSGIPERGHRSLLRMQRAGRDMEAIIDAFLILARESENAPLTEDFDVGEVVDEEIEKVRPLLARKPVELDLVTTGSPRLHASPRVLAVMLGQLLDNACTFIEKGRIEVRVEPDRIVIADTGIGMAPEILQKAYDPFYRANQFNPTGKGMGLSIVRRLGERFGWPVTLESTPGVGTIAIIAFARHVIP